VRFPVGGFDRILPFPPPPPQAPPHQPHPPPHHPPTQTHPHKHKQTHTNTHTHTHTPHTHTVLQLYEDAHDGRRPTSPLDDPAQHEEDAAAFVSMAQAAMEGNGLGRDFLSEAELRCVRICVCACVRACAATCFFAVFGRWGRWWVWVSVRALVGLWCAALCHNELTHPPHTTHSQTNNPQTAPSPPRPPPSSRPRAPSWAGFWGRRSSRPSPARASPRSTASCGTAPRTRGAWCGCLPPLLWARGSRGEGGWGC
jgi:hypothetical protein